MNKTGDGEGEVNLRIAGDEPAAREPEDRMSEVESESGEGGAEDSVPEDAMNQHTHIRPPGKQLLHNAHFVT